MVKKVDHIDLKIMKKMAYVAPCQTRLINFESSWLKIFALYKVEIFDITIGN
jgi:hypothetical protein